MLGETKVRMTMATKQDGVISTWIGERGFGFIRSADGTADIFTHLSDLPAPVAPAIGTAVRFQLTETPKGLRAIDVEIV
jgi:cold shock CspA family protein